MKNANKKPDYYRQTIESTISNLKTSKTVYRTAKLKTGWNKTDQTAYSNYTKNQLSSNIFANTKI